MDDKDTLLIYYFQIGLNYKEIISVMNEQHAIFISMSQLKRFYRRCSLRRRKDYTDLHTVVDFIAKDIQVSGRQHGYRWMYLKLLQNGFIVKRETVRLVFKELDPDGVCMRTAHRLVRRTYRNNGPNFLWHMDGYDKLKPYRIAIHGCIDGFSRKLIMVA